MTDEYENEDQQEHELVAANSNETVIYFFCATNSEGDLMYYFVKPKRPDGPALKSSNFNDHGEIVLSGFGVPTEEELFQMHADYHIDIDAVREIALNYGRKHEEDEYEDEFEEDDFY